MRFTEDSSFILKSYSYKHDVNVQDKNVKPVKNWPEPQKVKDVQSLGPIGNQARWFSILEIYYFKKEHREGVIHANADALSRIPIHRCQKWPDC